MDLSTVKSIEQIALDTDVCVRKRAFAAGIPLVTYASLRFADVQHLRPFEINRDSIHGTLLCSKTKKPRGPNWPRACPRMGLAGGTHWIQPIVDIRAAYRRANGRDMCYTSPRLDRKLQLVSQGATPYSTTRRKLALMRPGLGGPNGEAYAHNSPKNLFPTEANQMRFDQRELAFIGHWSSTSRMPERYGRSFCAIELLLRNTIVQQIVAGCNITPSYHLPETVNGHLRIGKPATLNDPTHPSTQLTAIQGDSDSLEPITAPNDDNSQIDSPSEIEKTETTSTENTVLTQTQNPTHTEPKTDVLALGS